MKIKTIDEAFIMWRKYVDAGCNVAFGNFVDCLKSRYIII